MCGGDVIARWSVTKVPCDEITAVSYRQRITFSRNNVTERLDGMQISCSATDMMGRCEVSTRESDNYGRPSIVSA